MKILKLLISVWLCMALYTPALYGICQLDCSIADITKGHSVPAEVSQQLESKLIQAMAKAGLLVSDYDSRFFVAGRFDDISNDITGGPSPKTYVKTTLTVYIGDVNDQKIFTSESFELSGVGNTEQQAYNRALNKLSSSNASLITFLQRGKDCIIEYFNTHYPTYLNNANLAAKARNYQEALYYVLSIPDCCIGYPEAQALALKIYTENMNQNSQQLMAQARAVWSADPTASGAERANRYLMGIDPESTAFKDAVALSKEMTATTKKQWEFENITKHNNAVALEKHRITAAKEAAIAWAKSRPKQVNRYVFITPRYY